MSNPRTGKLGMLNEDDDGDADDDDEEVSNFKCLLKKS